LFKRFDKKPGIARLFYVPLRGIFNKLSRCKGAKGKHRLKADVVRARILCKDDAWSALPLNCTWRS